MQMRGKEFIMYKKFAFQLFLCNLLLGMVWFCVKGIELNAVASTPAFQMSLMETDSSQPQAFRFFGFLRQASSGQRVVDYEVLEKENKYELSKEDYNVLLRIVQAEAGNEDEKGKMLVAGVVLNRVEHEAFPDTVEEVVFQNENGTYQFSPIANGSYYSVTVSDETREAVDKVLAGEDVTQGALYFAARKYADSEKMKWFDASLDRLFVYGGHEFFK